MQVATQLQGVVQKISVFTWRNRHTVAVEDFYMLLSVTAQAHKKNRTSV